MTAKSKSYHQDIRLPATLSVSSPMDRACISQHSESGWCNGVSTMTVVPGIDCQHARIAPMLPCSHLPAILPPPQYKRESRTDFYRALRMIGRVKRPTLSRADGYASYDYEGVVGRTAPVLRSRRPETEAPEYLKHALNMNNTWKPETSSNRNGENKK